METRISDLVVLPCFWSFGAYVFLIDFIRSNIACVEPWKLSTCWEIIYIQIVNIFQEEDKLIEQ